MISKKVFGVYLLQDIFIILYNLRRFQISITNTGPKPVNLAFVIVLISTDLNYEYIRRVYPFNATKPND